jgi:hypothetical protein
MRFIQYFNSKTGVYSEPEQAIDENPKYEQQIRSYIGQLQRNKLLRANEILQVYHDAYKYRTSLWTKIKNLFRATKTN